jgi:uncharacterized protein YciI
MSSDGSQSNVYVYTLLAAHPEMMSRNLTPGESQAMEAHLDRLKVLRDEGVIVISGRTLNNDETTFGIVMLRADSVSAAREIMNTDPGIKGGIFKGTLFPFLITAEEPH